MTPINEGATQIDFPEQKDTQRSRQPPRGLRITEPSTRDAASPTLVYVHIGRDISYSHTDTHTTPPPISGQVFGDASSLGISPNNSPGSAWQEYPLLASFWARIFPLPFPLSS